MNYGLQYGNDQTKIKHQESLGFGSSVNCRVVHLGFIQFILLKRKEKKASKNKIPIVNAGHYYVSFCQLLSQKRTPCFVPIEGKKDKKEGGVGGEEERNISDVEQR